MGGAQEREFKTLVLSFCKVVIGGKNKYLINGVNAKNTRVQDLFCSVGLNVNNPHFLIMQVRFIFSSLIHSLGFSQFCNVIFSMLQGRITKVLNMKPPEVKYTLHHPTISALSTFV